jgi:YHS domain-containing protein
MELTTFETDESTVRAGYACPCGCTPSVAHQRGGAAATNVCCCGNEFVVGPDAERSLTPRDGFRLETEPRTAAWGEPVTAAWLVGPSVHPEPTEDGGGHGHGHHHDSDDDSSAAVDPVCGMTVEPPTAREKGLHSHYDGVDHFFCGKGCKLEFDEDQQRYLDPSYVPTM